MFKINFKNCKYVSSDIKRCENDEVICYVMKSIHKGGISCFKK